MRPELVGLAILTGAVGAVVLLMLADRAGWQSPLPRFTLDRRWMALTWVLMGLLVVLQALRLAGLL